MTAPDAVLFDLDGTLLWLDVDVEPARAAIRQLFAARGYTGAMRPLLAAIDDAAATVARDDAERIQLRAEARGLIDRAELEAAASARARDGAAALLARAGAVRLGIVTDNGRACVAPALASAGLGAVARFACVVSRDDVALAKPEPSGVVIAARALLPGGGRLWLVGDSPRDVLAGRAARAQLPDVELAVVAVRGGRGADADLEAAGPDRIVDALGATMAPAWRAP